MLIFILKKNFFLDLEFSTFATFKLITLLNKASEQADKGRDSKTANS